jgi:hypothetical protein
MLYPTDWRRAALLLLLLFCLSSSLAAQGVAIGTGNPSPDASAMLDVIATGKGVLVPRMTAAQRPTSPVTGLLIFNTDVSRFEFWNGLSWQQLTTGGGTGFSLPFTGSASSPSASLEITNTATSLGASGILGVSNATSSFGSGVLGVNFAASGNGTGVFGGVFSPVGFGVIGANSSSTGTGVGVRGEVQSDQGTALLGLAFATTGATLGVNGQSSSTAGTGVLGQVFPATGATVGVRGDVNSNQGAGVVGNAFSATGNTVGVNGQVISTAGIGMLGQAFTTTGITSGVRGDVNSDQGTGVVGTAFSSTGSTIGVRGNVNSDQGAGVFGFALSTTGINYGVFGQTLSPAGFAGWFEGNVNVTGTLAKGGGSFKIDHPLDPENQYLYHSFVESPDMMNIYNGNITTDAQGYAVIELPNWFSALNKDFRYQLTPIGTFAQAIVAEEVSGNRFRIQTDKPNIKVSWQVTGVRKDAFAETHRIPVEEPKPAAERGKYLHPEELGKSKTLGLHYERTRELEQRESLPAMRNQLNTSQETMKNSMSNTRANTMERDKALMEERKREAETRRATLMPTKQGTVSEPKAK